MARQAVFDRVPRPSATFVRQLQDGKVLGLHVRDSKGRAGSRLAFTDGVWSAFVVGVADATTPRGL